VKRLIEWMLVAVLVSTTALAQTPQLIDLGAQPSFAWDHDGVNTTHYRFYVSTGSTPNATGAAQVGELAKPTAASGTVEMVYPTKFSAPGTFNIYVTAVNKSLDTNVNTGESPKSSPLLIEVKKATLPIPSTPVKVAADGRIEFYVAGVQ
jgi:hypothetical protein